MSTKTEGEHLEYPPLTFADHLHHAAEGLHRAAQAFEKVHHTGHDTPSLACTEDSLEPAYDFICPAAGLSPEWLCAKLLECKISADAKMALEAWQGAYLASDNPPPLQNDSSTPSDPENDMGLSPSNAPSTASPAPKTSLSPPNPPSTTDPAPITNLTALAKGEDRPSPSASDPEATIVPLIPPLPALTPEQETIGPVYLVTKGRPLRGRGYGIYSSWAETSPRVTGVSFAVFNKLPTMLDAHRAYEAARLDGLLANL